MQKRERERESAWEKFNLHETNFYSHLPATTTTRTEKTTSRIIKKCSTFPTIINEILMWSAWNIFGAEKFNEMEANGNLKIQFQGFHLLWNVICPQVYDFHMLNEGTFSLKFKAKVFHSIYARIFLPFSVMACSANQGNPETAQSVYEFTVNDIKGEPVSLEKYKGHVLIIVNVASKCGYTAKHYAELNEIYDQYAESKGELLIIVHSLYIHGRCRWSSFYLHKKLLLFFLIFNFISHSINLGDYSSPFLWVLQ